MYKYAEIKIREIADRPTIASFEASIGMPVDWNQVEHMVTDDGDHLDLTKAKTPAHAALFYYLTKDPTKQNRGEKKQSLSLNDSFKEVVKLTAGSTTIINGKKATSSEVVGGIQDDLDWEIYSERVLISGKDVDGKGGSQDDQFDEMVRLIERTGLTSDLNSWTLGIFLTGSLWDLPRKEYRNFNTKYKFSSLRSLLGQIAKGKKVVIFTESELPTSQTTFHKHFKV